MLKLRRADYYQLIAAASLPANEVKLTLTTPDKMTKCLPRHNVEVIQASDMDLLQAVEKGTMRGQKEL